MCIQTYFLLRCCQSASLPGTSLWVIFLFPFMFYSLTHCLFKLVPFLTFSPFIKTCNLATSGKQHLGLVSAYCKLTATSEAMFLLFSPLKFLPCKIIDLPVINKHLNGFYDDADIWDAKLCTLFPYPFYPSESEEDPVGKMGIWTNRLKAITRPSDDQSINLAGVVKKEIGPWVRSGGNSNSLNGYRVKDGFIEWDEMAWYFKVWQF